jgi:SAM-dependent methyltransferase
MGASYNLLVRAIHRILEIPKRGFPELPNRTRFDEEWGTQTEKIVWLTNPGSRNFIHGVRYEPCSPVACSWAIENAQIDFPEFYFVDVGCGKGRPLLIASRYPFVRLIGIDYSAQLCRQARANLERSSVPPERFDIFCGDAAEFLFMRHDTFAYLHNPFGTEVLQRVLDNLHDLTRTNRLTIAYEGPRVEELTKVSWLYQVGSGPNVSLFAAVKQRETP